MANETMDREALEAASEKAAASVPNLRRPQQESFLNKGYIVLTGTLTGQVHLAKQFKKDYAGSFRFTVTLHPGQAEAVTAYRDAILREYGINPALKGSYTGKSDALVTHESIFPPDQDTKWIPDPDQPVVNCIVGYGDKPQVMLYRAPTPVDAINAEVAGLPAPKGPVPVAWSPDTVDECFHSGTEVTVLLRFYAQGGKIKAGKGKSGLYQHTEILIADDWSKHLGGGRPALLEGSL